MNFSKSTRESRRTSKIDQQEATLAELKSTIAQQQKEMETVIARVKVQAVQIQKVSAQIEVSKPTPRMAVRNP